MAETVAVGEVSPCCQKRENRRVIPVPSRAIGFSAEICIVCERKHTTLHVNEAIARRPHD